LIVIYDMRVTLGSSVKVSVALAIVAALSAPASAQSLKGKVTGAWTLVSGSENYPDGKKNTPWATGNLILDPTGHVALFLVGKDQPTSSPSVRTPVGPFIGYYGAFTVDDANNTLTYKIEHSGSPLVNGTTRVMQVTFDGDTMTWTGSQIKTPEGVMTPINVWKKAE
jgi:hypothetical protein